MLEALCRLIIIFEVAKTGRLNGAGPRHEDILIQDKINGLKPNKMILGSERRPSSCSSEL
jgi:hypothetical protein